MAKTSKTSKVVATVKNIAGLIIGQIYCLLISGGKGSAFRLAKYQGGNSFKLTQNNVGLSYDGALIDIANIAKLDKQAKLELGNYIAGRGKPVAIKVLKIADAEKLCKISATVERHNGKEVVLQVADTSKQYTPSIEKFGKGKIHFFQLETKRIKGRNEKHYGALLKTK